MSEEKIWPSLPEVRPPSPLLVPNTPGLTHSRQTFAVTYLFRTSGQVLGVSLSGALLQAVLTNKLRERITGPGAIEVCISRLRIFSSRLNSDSIFFFIHTDYREHPVRPLHVLSFLQSITHSSSTVAGTQQLSFPSFL